MKTLPWIFISCFLTCASAALGASPVVTNVVASQRSGTKLVDIRYDALDSDGDLLKVRIEISHNAGTNYGVPAVSLTGDIGSNVTPGTNKLIVWNAGIDWDGEYSPLMRVKVIASDSRGFPGMEWGQEVPPGGFLLGQDGGPEGVGPAKHVNIPYSYWLGKYEVTVGQFAEFLNTALAAGEISRSGNTISAVGTAFAGVPANTSIYDLGSDLQWNLNKIVVLAGKTNLPVTASWYAAVAFAQYYGYDLPTDAEWEKAARGPEHDGLGEHLLYPWGNTISGVHANFNQSGDGYEPGRTPVGYYNGSQGGVDMANAYGLYDVIGNVPEWTRTKTITSDAYPANETITNAIHALTPDTSRVFRGGAYNNAPSENALRLYCRNSNGAAAGLGFRVARRSL